MLLPVCAQQQTPAEQPQPDQKTAQENASQAPAVAQPQSPTESTDQESADQSGNNDAKKPGALGRLKRHMRDQVSSGCVNALGTHCWDKPPKDDSQQTGTQAKNVPPRSDDTPAGESSSKATKVDLSPPPGEAPPPGMGTTGEANDVKEFKPWDPHKADKNVEVGDFYFKRGNYRAALSRYQEALYWKDDDAIALFRLGACQEKLGEYPEARKNYEAYLKILPDGEFSAEAKKGIERLKDKAEETLKTAGNR